MYPGITKLAELIVLTAKMFLKIMVYTDKYRSNSRH